MNNKRPPSIRELLERMSIDELMEARRMMQSELDRRQGRKKFDPIQAWPRTSTR